MAHTHRHKIFANDHMAKSRINLSSSFQVVKLSVATQVVVRETTFTVQCESERDARHRRRRVSIVALMRVFFLQRSS